MSNIETHLSLDLPDWLPDELASFPVLADQTARIDAVNRLASRNVREQTGGPFAALVVNREGVILSAGVNLVTTSGISSAHAEVVALGLAHRKLGTWDLSSHDLELVSSCEPCAMCTGAVLWSGVRSLVYSASGEDARRIGFDEGDKTTDWADGLRRRGIAVTGPVQRDQGARVFEHYLNAGGKVYNSGSNR
ncbi:nucleoside deaminase [bacterium]|nr:nucleoside deaminase [bacterium]